MDQAALAAPRAGRPADRHRRLPERIPPLQTGVPHLILANTTQIYPEDRGTNYAVRLGGEAAEALLSRRLNNVWSETGS